MAGYFSRLGAVWFTLKDGSTILVNDLTAFATFSNDWRKDQRTQLNHKIADGELPHQISEKLYDTVDYWWIVLLFNNIYDFDNQWPRNQKQLKNYIDLKYPGQNPDDVHHYINPQGLVSDILSLKLAMGLTTDEDVIYEANLEAITIAQYEEILNEQKRDIILVDPDYIGAVLSDFERLMENN